MLRLERMKVIGYLNSYCKLKVPKLNRLMMMGFGSNYDHNVLNQVYL